MGSKTGIEWTDATWNPILGCSRVSEGCRNCYAESIAARFGNGQPTVYSGLTQIVNGHPQWTGKIAETKKLLEPLSWRKPKRVFVNSMSDLFHENVTDEQRDRIFAVMALSPQHTFQVLTKRPARMLEYFAKPAGFSFTWREGYIQNAAYAIKPDAHFALTQWPLPNVWLGVSVENQAAADGRIPLLLQAPAAKRFISAEPLLGQVNLFSNLGGTRWVGGQRGCIGQHHGIGTRECPRELHHHHDDRCRAGLDWVICGGESGPHARPMHPDWAQLLRDQCQAAAVPFFFKQWGEFGTAARCLTTGESVFRQFRDFQHWVNKADTWVNGGICLDADGKPLQRGADFKAARYPVTIMHKVGKHAAGALLDGVEHRQFPESRQ